MQIYYNKLYIQSTIKIVAPAIIQKQQKVLVQFIVSLHGALKQYLCICLLCYMNEKLKLSSYNRYLRSNPVEEADFFTTGISQRS